MTHASSRDIAELTAREMASAVATGAVLPADLVDIFLDRIGRLEPSISAWSYLDERGARAVAAELTREAAAGKFRGALHGVPIGIKDQFHVRGMPSYMRAPDPFVAPADATVVKRLREAGAVILGKLHMPIAGTPPPTRNPWHLEHTPGGSSSGAGAAVAARMVPLAVGEQTGGSGLRPAAYCGIDALKPTYGRISRVGCSPIAPLLDHPVIIARDVADIALVLSVVAGWDPADPESLRDDPPTSDLFVDALPSPRIGVVENFFPELTEPSMQAAVMKAAARLASAGATVVSAHLPDEFALTWDVWQVLSRVGDSVFAEAGAAVTDAPATWRLRNRVAQLIPASYYLHAIRVRRWLRDRMPVAFGELDALLMAATPAAAPRGLDSTGDPVLLNPWSALGFPAITINGGRAADGLPLGLQFVAPAKADYSLCRVAAWCEHVLGRLPPPPLSSALESANLSI